MTARAAAMAARAAAAARNCRERHWSAAHEDAAKPWPNAADAECSETLLNAAHGEYVLREIHLTRVLTRTGSRSWNLMQERPRGQRHHLGRRYHVVDHDVLVRLMGEIQD